MTNADVDAGSPDRSSDPRRGSGGGIESMTAEQVGWVIERTCMSKQRFDDPGKARAAAWRVRKMTLRPLHAYRCPFGDGKRANAHWHVGHVPSMAALHRIAAAIRARAQGVGPQTAA